MSANILVETKDRIARIEIARTDKKNALTQAMYRAMLKALGDADADAQVRAILIHGARSPHGAIDRQPNRDLAEPTGKPIGLAELRQLAECLNEHVLRQLGRFGAVPQPAESDRKYGRLKCLNKLSECFAIPSLSLQYERQEFVGVHDDSFPSLACGRLRDAVCELIRRS